MRLTRSPATGTPKASGARITFHEPEVSMQQQQLSMRAHPRRLVTAVALLTPIALVVACSDGGSAGGVSEPLVTAGTLGAPGLLAMEARPDQPTGYLRVCAAGAPNVTGTFSFAIGGPNVTGQTVTVPAGQCTGPIAANVGAVSVTQVARAGYSTSEITVAPSAGSTTNVGTATASVSVVKGGVDDARIVTFRNVTSTVSGGTATGTLTVCKIAGTGVNVGASYSFTATAGQNASTFNVSAGPGAHGGTCVPVGGLTNPTRYPLGAQVTITEAAVTGVRTGVIRVAPGDRGTSDLAARSATVTIGTGETVVTFTNTTEPPHNGGTGVGGTGLASLEVCTWGAGSAAGKTFDYRSTATGSTTTHVVAGSTAPGNCATLSSTLAAGTAVTITQSALEGYRLSSATFSGSGTANVTARTGTLTLVAGSNRVTFYNVPNETACSRGLGYFKSHVDAITSALEAGRGRHDAHVSTTGTLTLAVGDDAMTAAQIATFLDTPPKGDARILLARQVIVAELNAMRTSAAMSSEMSATLAAANTLLAGGISDLESAAAKTLAERLDALNAANSCEDDED